MNRLKNDEKLSNVAAWRLAAAYAIIGREDAARELAQASTEIQSYREMGYGYGSHLRDIAMIIETMAYLKDYSRGNTLMKELAGELKTGWHSTQTRAYALVAVSKFIGDSDPDSEFEFSLTINGENKTWNSELPYRKVEVNKDHLMNGRVEFKNHSQQVLFTSFVQTGIPVEINDEPVRKDLGMTIRYTDMDGNTLDVTRLKQGQDFKAVVNLSHPGVRSSYLEVALNQVFPSGWQIVNTRVGEQSDNATGLKYQDIRDDRVYSYFDLHKNKYRKVEVLLNATFCGKFYLPGIFCAPMYDESIQALEPGKWVEVVPE
jgi:uncharacterized protein YfaS (alpha-2-macroglobulin family)